MQKTFTNPEGLPDWSDFFTQVVTVKGDGYKTIHISGQVGVDSDKNLVGAGDFAAQTEQTFKNLATALASAGATPADVVNLNIYVVNYRYEHAAVIGEQIRKYFPAGKLPACSLLGVQALAMEQFLIEVDAIAVVEIEDK